MAFERASGAPPHAGTGGGQTAGMGNTGKSIGAGRPDRIAMNLDFVTPNYDWSQANIGNFGITGALGNALAGLVKGNTYNQGTPSGFTGGTSKGKGGSGEKTVAPADNIAGGQRIADILARRALLNPPAPVAPAAPWVSPFARTLIPRYVPGSQTSLYQGV